MDDLLREFLMESSESLAELDVELVQFEQNPNDKGLLGNIFRLVHTVKGTCGFLGLARLESVAHASENVLGKIRDGELEVTPEAISLILESIDAIKDIMAALEKTEGEPEGDDKDLIDRLNALADGKAAPAKGKKKSGKGKTSSGSDDSLYERLGGEKPGLLGSAIIDGKATEILDAGYYLSIGQRDWFGTQGRQGAFGIGGGAK